MSTFTETLGFSNVPLIKTNFSLGALRCFAIASAQFKRLLLGSTTYILEISGLKAMTDLVQATTAPLSATTNPSGFVYNLQSESPFKMRFKSGRFYKMLH